MAIPSLAMIPSGYKDGKVYSVLPANGDGDFDFSRGSNATRVNKDGLIETMPLGVSDTELITNGSFAADSDWVKGTGWTISGGVASKSAGSQSDLDQYTVTTLGDSYKVKLTVSGVTAGSISVRLGTSSSNTIGLIDANGTYTFYGTVTADLRFRIRANAAFSGSIDNVSVKEVMSGFDLPRLDYTDSSCPSLLLEPQSTNLVTYSELPSTWTYIEYGSGSNGTITTGKTDMFGGTNAVQVDFPSNAENASLWFGSLTSSLSSGSETSSVYIKLVGSDTTDKTIQIRTGGNASEITLSGTEYVRYSASTTLLSNEAINLKIRPSQGTSSGGFSIIVCHPQSENNSYPTSYIPTSGSIVTRLADECNLNVSDLGLSEITEYFSDGTSNVITSIPSTYTISTNTITKIIAE